MYWLECITQTDGRLSPVYVDEAGCRTIGSLKDARGGLVRRGYRAAIEHELVLETASVVDCAEYLDAMGVTGVDPAGHRVYELQGASKRILVPAVVLLSSLVGRLSNVGDRLLEPASLERVATPLVDKEGHVAVGFSRKSYLRVKGWNNPSVQSRFVWLTCFPSARTFWGSIYRYAAQGQLALDLPMATIDATFSGSQKGNTIYATRVAIRKLVPYEQPLPFARNRVVTTFDFDEYSAARVHNMNVLKASFEVHPRITSQADLLRGPAGWPMTEQEWLDARAELTRLGFTPPLRVKRSIDLVLEKFGSAKTWRSLGAHWQTADAVYQRWRRKGQWDAFKEVLNAMRRESVDV